MFNKHLHTYLLPFIACLVFSCVSDSPDYTAPDNETELTFTVAELSRASVTTGINTPGSKFAVYGDIKVSEASNADPTIIFNKTEVEYVGNTWSYDNTQYWFPKHDHSFVAIFPVSIVSPENDPQYSGSELSFTYTIPASSENEIAKNDVVDILGATHRRYYEPGDVVLPVSLRFSHMMTLINIGMSMNDNVMGTDAYIQLKKIEFSGLKNKATFKILPAQILSNNQTDDRLIDVIDQEGETKMTIEFAESKKIMNLAETVSLFDANDAIIMLPQEFAADSQAKIIFTYAVNDEQETAQVSCPLKLMKWESGKSYLYNFMIERTGVKFDNYEINPWNTIRQEDDIIVD